MRLASDHSRPATTNLATLHSPWMGQLASLVGGRVWRRRGVRGHAPCIGPQPTGNHEPPYAALAQDPAIGPSGRRASVAYAHAPGRACVVPWTAPCPHPRRRHTRPYGCCRSTGRQRPSVASMPPCATMSPCRSRTISLRCAGTSWPTRKRRWPRACGRARWTSSSGRSTSSGRAGCCAARSRPTSSARSSSTARPAPARPPSPGSSPTPRAATSSPSTPCSRASPTSARPSRRRRSAADSSASARSSSSTRCTASTRRSRTRCCRGSRTARSSSSARRPRTPTSRSTRPSSAAPHLPAQAARRSRPVSRWRGRRWRTRSAATASSTCSSTDDALAHLVNVANGDARGVLNALELAVETTPPDDEGVIRVDLARRRGEHPAPRGALRQGRRRPLRHDQRVHQEPARVRPGRGDVLDGAHGLRGRGPALHLPAHDHLCRARTLGWPTRTRSGW